MKPLRKGARALEIDGTEFSWFAGKTFVEVRNRKTDRAFHIPRPRVETEIQGCDCGCGMGWGQAVTPGQVSSFVRNHRDEHLLL